VILFHCDRRAPQAVARTRVRPQGYGGIRPSAALAFPGDRRVSPSSRRFSSGTMALAARHYGLPHRARGGYASVAESTLLSELASLD